MDPMAAPEVGRRLRELRKRRQVTQDALATAMGLDQSAVHRIETGQRNIQVGEMIAACEHLLVPIEALLKPKDASLALRANASAEEVETAERAFRRVIDDFFAFRTAAG